MENKNDKMNIINEGFYREDKHTIEEGFLPLTDEEKYVLSNGIVLTREYQMKVDSSLFLNRSQGIQYYIDGFFIFYLLFIYFFIYLFIFFFFFFYLFFYLHNCFF